jgi:hypothetical protein
MKLQRPSIQISGSRPRRSSKKQLRMATGNGNASPHQRIAGLQLITDNAKRIRCL